MFEGDDRYARNDLRLWLEQYGKKGDGPGSPRSGQLSPRSPTKAPGGSGKGDEGKEGVEGANYVVATGTGD